MESPVLLPLELPELDPVLGDGAGDAGGVVGDAGDVLELLLPLVPPVPALEPDLLK